MLHMESPRANDFLVTEKIGKLMGKYALPCMISLLVAATVCSAYKKGGLKLCKMQKIPILYQIS